MSYEWGRAAEAGKWQRAVPVWLMSVILLALASGVGVWWVRQTFVWTPLQQFYLSAYTRSAMASSLAIQTGRYRLLLMDNRRGSRLAIDEEVVPISSPTGEPVNRHSRCRSSPNRPAVAISSGGISSSTTPVFTPTCWCGSTGTRR